jgi:hypothetical protein
MTRASWESKTEAILRKAFDAGRSMLYEHEIYRILTLLDLGVPVHCTARDAKKITDETLLRSPRSCRSVRFSIFPRWSPTTGSRRPSISCFPPMRSTSVRFDRAPRRIRTHHRRRSGRRRQQSRRPHRCDLPPTLETDSCIGQCSSRSGLGFQPFLRRARIRGRPDLSLGRARDVEPQRIHPP